MSPADADRDGEVGLSDLLVVLDAMENRGTSCPSPCAADIDGDGRVDDRDVSLLLSSWSARAVTPRRPARRGR